MQEAEGEAHCAKLDRLSRNVGFISALMDSGVEFVAADMPHANKMALQVLAVFAEYERDQPKVRTGDQSGIDAATAEWNRVQSEWQTRGGCQSFETKRSELERLKQELDQLPNSRLRKLDELKARQRQLQMEEFLDGFEIDRATIPSIGAGRKQTLSSYGIETAADITERQLAKVPGFGPVLYAKLMDWRASIEARFRFVPKRQIDPRHIAQVEQDILSQKRQIEDQLRSGSAELRAIHAQIFAARQHMRPQVEAVYARYLQAMADFDAATN